MPNMLTIDQSTNDVSEHLAFSTTIVNTYELAESGSISLDFYGGNMYVGSYTADTITKYVGLSITVSSSIASPGTFPAGITHDSSGNLHSCDLTDDEVSVHTLDTTTVTDTYSTIGNVPYGLTMYNDNLILCDSNNDTIYIYVGSGSTLDTSFLIDSARSATGVDVYDGNMYIADSVGNEIVQYNGITSSEAAAIATPGSLAVGVVWATERLMESTSNAVFFGINC